MNPLRSSVSDALGVVLKVLDAPASDEALDRLVRAVVADVGCRAAVVRLLDPETGRMELVAAHGVSQAYLAKGPVALPASGLDARVLAGEAGEIVELADVTTDPAFQYGRRAAEEGLRSVLAVPVFVHGAPRGVLRAYTAEPHPFSDAERSSLAALARLGGEVIERARRGEALQAIMRDVASTLDVGEVVDRLLRHTVEGLHFSAASIRLLDEESGGLVLAGARGLSRRYLRAGERRADDPAFGRVLAGETQIVHDIEKEGGLPFVDEARADGIRSVLSVPLPVRGSVIGLLRVYSRRERRFDPYEVRFVRLVAELGALALDNARLHRLLADRVDALRAETSGWYRFLTLG